MLRPRRLPPGATVPTRADWLSLQPGPAGMAVVNGSAAHKVSRGQTLHAIARTYSAHYHLDISASDLQRANGMGSSTLIRSGQHLRLPPIVNALIDHRIKMNPGLVMVDRQAMHQIGTGETLSAIARHYNREFRTSTTPAGIHRANTDVIRNINAIHARMAPIAIPGLSVPAAAGAEPVVPPTLSQLDGVEVATRRADVTHEDGTKATIDVMHYYLDGSHARHVGGSINDAMRAAREAVASGEHHGGPAAAVVQARDGYWVAPVRAEEDGGLDDSTRTDRLFLQQANPWLQGWAELDRSTGEVTTDNWPDPRDY